jgi:predicted acylesterase/phospholipase RssA
MLHQGIETNRKCARVTGRRFPRSICMWCIQSFSKKEIRIGIVAGTSTGAINGAIIVGRKSGHPENVLDEFWLEIAESNYKIIPDFYLFDYDSRNQIKVLTYSNLFDTLRY